MFKYISFYTYIFIKLIVLMNCVIINLIKNKNLMML